MWLSKMKTKWHLPYYYNHCEIRHFITCTGERNIEALYKYKDIITLSCNPCLFNCYENLVIVYRLLIFNIYFCTFCNKLFIKHILLFVILLWNDNKHLYMKSQNTIKNHLSGIWIKNHHFVNNLFGKREKCN